MKDITKERPIIFSVPMVAAILEGRKTQTRRALKFQDFPEFSQYGNGVIWHGVPPRNKEKCPYGKTGDRLWVRENFHSDTKDMEYARAQHEDAISASPIFYQANYDKSGWFNAGFITKSALSMPRWASRVTLEITNVRVERLQDISEDDAKAEGADQVGYETGGITASSHPIMSGSYVLGYYETWELINGPGSWDKNPWVWVLEFKRVL